MKAIWKESTSRPLATPTIRVLSARTPIAGLVAVATLGAGVAAHAEPLSIVQTLRNGEDGTAFPGFVQDLETNGNQLVVGVSGELQLYTRDPASGALMLVDSLPDYDGAAPVAGDETQFDDSINVLADGRVVVNGSRRNPMLCDISQSCAVFGPLVLSTEGDRFTPVAASSRDGASTMDLAVPADGRHAYGLNGEGNGGGFSIFSLNDSGEASVVETLDADFLLGGTRGLALDVEFSLDGRFLFVNVNETGSTNSPSDANFLVTLARDPESGRLTRVGDIEITTEADGLDGVRSLVAAPDGTTLYVALDADDGAESGLARYAIAADGTLTRLAIDSSPNASVPSSFAFPGDIAVSPNGRLVLVANDIGSADEAESLHLFTVGDDGTTTWRGFEQSNNDGVLEKDLEDIETVRFSPDGAYVHVFAGLGDDGGVLSTFAAHADNVTTIAAPSNALAGGDATATVRLFNGGPAVAHGLVATIDASGPIGSTDRPDDCTISGSQAVCRIDELAVMGSADIAVTAAAPAEGALTLSAETTQYQTDLDQSSNAATASVPVVDDPTAVDTAPTTPAPTTPDPTEEAGSDGAEGSSGSGGSSGGGGCSVASDGARDPLFALLMLLGLGGFAARGRRRGRSG